MQFCFLNFLALAIDHNMPIYRIIINAGHGALYCTRYILRSDAIETGHG